MSNESMVYEERAGIRRAAQLDWARKASRTGNPVWHAAAEHYGRDADFWGRMAVEASQPAPRPSLLRRIGEFLGVV